ncbi:MAG: MFS transporter [Caulobacteraceae bacterium]
MADIVEGGPLPAAEAAALEARTGAHRGASPLGQFAWAAFDGARSPYNVLVNIFVFSAYFSTVVVPDSVRGQAVWSYVTSTGAFLVAIGAPILGAIADAGGRRKPWLIATVILGVPCMSLIWFATPGMSHGLIWVMAAIVGSTLAFEYSAIFCNAMLPNVAPQGRLGFLSGLGFALGNFFGVLVFLFFLLAWSWNPHPLFGLDAARHEPERAVGMLAAAWFAVFAIPLLLFTPDSPGTSRSVPQAVSHGLKTLAGTLSKLGHYRNAATFLGARMLYNEGFIVLMLFTGVFAAGILHWTPTMLIAEGLINSVVAALAGLGAGWLDTRIGSKASSMLFVGGCLAANLVLCSVTPDMVFFIHVAPPLVPHGLFPSLPDKVFLVAQCSCAMFVTGGLVTSRALMAKLSPRAMLNEFFGLFALSGTATSFIGPLSIGVLTTLAHSQRAGVAVGIVFLLSGLLVMTLVKEHPAEG